MISSQSTTLRSCRDIARPVIGLQRRQRVLADAPRRHAGTLRGALHEMARQHGHVLAAFAQRRHAQRDHVEAIEQILAEAAGGDLRRGRGCWSRRPGHRPRPGCRRPARKSAPEGCARSCPGSPAACRRPHRGPACRHEPVRRFRCAIRRHSPTRSTPNSSASMRSGCMAAQLTSTIGPWARFDRRCSIRAATSLPDPAGPVINTRDPVGAIRSMVCRS